MIGKDEAEEIKKELKRGFIDYGWNLEYDESTKQNCINIKKQETNDNAIYGSDIRTIVEIADEYDLNYYVDFDNEYIRLH